MTECGFILEKLKMKNEPDLFNIVKIGFVLWFSIIIIVFGFLGYLINRVLTFFGI